MINIPIKMMFLVGRLKNHFSPLLLSRLQRNILVPENVILVKFNVYQFLKLLISRFDNFDWFR